MDEKTRFHLVSIVTKTREIEDAKKAFKESKKVGNKKPRLMVTDELRPTRKPLTANFTIITSHVNISLMLLSRRA